MKFIQKHTQFTLPLEIEPVPILSQNIVVFINDILNKFKITHFVEYGMGNSTIYFLKTLLSINREIKFISTEFDPKWYEGIISILRNLFKYNDSISPSLRKSVWTYDDCKYYLNSNNRSNLSVPKKLQRLEKSKKKFRGKFNYKLLLYRLIPKTRPYNADFSVCIEKNIKLHLFLRAEFFKDQYGESPYKDKYINAAFDMFNDDIADGKKVVSVFLIDGGPRCDILGKILDFEEEHNRFFPIIFLCDANRVYFKKQIKRRKKGVFLKGNNIILSKQELYKFKKYSSKLQFLYGKKEVNIDELTEKEVWYYNSLMV